MPKKRKGHSTKIEPLAREHFTFRKVRPRSGVSAKGRLKSHRERPIAGVCNTPICYVDVQGVCTSNTCPMASPYCQPSAS